MKTDCCQHVRPFLELHALGALGQRDARVIEEHLARCPRCRALADQCASLVRSVCRNHSAEASQQFIDRIKAAGRRELVRQRRRALLRRAAVPAAAAAVALAVLLPWRAWVDGSRATRPAGSAARRAANFATAHPADAHVEPLPSASRRWHLAYRTLGHLAATEERVFVVLAPRAGKVALTALDAAGGRLVWAFVQDSVSRHVPPTGPVVLSRREVCWSHAGRLHLLEAGSGRLIWSKRLPGESLLSGGAPAEGGLYVAGRNGLYCLDRAHGSVTRVLAGPAALPVARRPLLATSNRRAYMVQRSADARGVLTCLYLPDGNVLWQEEVVDVQSIVAKPDGVYLRGCGRVICYRPDGRRAWGRSAPGCGALTDVSGLLYFVISGEADAARLVAVDHRTGRQVWAGPSVPSCGAFVRTDSHGYILSKKGDIYSYTLAMKAP